MAELISKRLRHRLILCGLLALGAYLLWYQVRLGTMREALNLEFSSLLGMDMPWMALLSGVWIGMRAVPLRAALSQLGATSRLVVDPPFREPLHFP